MPLIAIAVHSNDPTPHRVVPADIRAVPAAKYALYEEAAGNPGGITRGELADDDIRALSTYEDGEAVYMEGDPGEVLDDEQGEATRIWWRARLIER